MFYETNWRTIYKIISWRIIFLIVNFANTYIVTGDWKAGLQVTALAAVVNSIIYWLHERIWNRIPVGKKA